MKKRNNKIIVIVTATVIFVVAFLIFILNYSKDETSFSILEKKWLNDNENNVIDISVYNDVPVFGESGNGIIFDYLNNFTEEHGINFNKVSYLVSEDKKAYKDLAFKILGTAEKVGDNDILLYNDYYVMVSTENKTLNDINDLTKIKLGVMSNDLSLTNYYLNEAQDISFNSGETKTIALKR